jgi:hypothetical protein
MWVTLATIAPVKVDLSICNAQLSPRESREHRRPVFQKVTADNEIELLKDALTGLRHYLFG